MLGYWIPVQACRVRSLWQIRDRLIRDVMWWTSVLKMVIPCLQEKPLNVETNQNRTANQLRWAGREF